MSVRIDFVDWLYIECICGKMFVWFVSVLRKIDWINNVWYCW